MRGNSLRSGAANKTRVLESVRLGLIVLTFLMALTILGTSGDALAVYNRTHISSDFLLPLWPVDFNLGPTIALVAGGSIVLVSSAISLAGSKTPAVRQRSLIHTIICIATPAASLIATLVATSFFYAINASDTTDTLQSWSCQWSDVVMTQEPHFGRLCKESETALYLTIALLPLEVLVMGLAGTSFLQEKKASSFEERKHSSSPAMS